MNDGWEVVTKATKNDLCRLKVDGGYIYRSMSYVEMPGQPLMVSGESMVFVPDVDLQRYQAHLRDAYKQGFADGAVDAHAQHQQAANLSNIPKEFVNV